MKKMMVETAVMAGVLLVLGAITLRCTPASREKIARDALDTADNACKTYLEIRNESKDAGAE